ncbi:hypothetical protein BRADI_2g37095v3 [Brachypodium distachyon]|uniref:Uncharacterized protein n=1 Tax=Brachypodium distachyon TaxID=15368 RepID=A0A0Q3G8G6_BRADI|nr:hypothetical protein BRADI_2g37095v3 [Brachypodium distachyon]
MLCRGAGLSCIGVKYEVSLISRQLFVLLHKNGPFLAHTVVAGFSFATKFITPAALVERSSTSVLIER